MKKLIFSLVAFLVLPFLVKGQCSEFFRVDLKNNEIKIVNAWLSQSNNYDIQILFSGIKKGTFSIKALDLENARSNSVLPVQSHLVIPPKINISPGEQEALKITIKNIPGPGMYKSKIYLAEDRGKCKTEFPLIISLLDPTKVSILGGDQGVNIKIARSSLPDLNGLLPAAANQQQFNLKIDNKTQDSIFISHVSFSLTGKTSLRSITEKDFDIDKNVVVGPNNDKNITLRLKSGTDLLPDEYLGILRVHCTDIAQPITANFNLKTKSSAAWALLLLILGVIMGIMVRDVQKHQGQITLMDRLVSVRAEIDELNDGAVKLIFNRELRNLEKEINQVKNDETKVEVEGQFQIFERKVNTISQLAAATELAKNKLKLNNDTAKISKLVSHYERIRDGVMTGKVENLNAELEKINAIVEESQTARNLDPNAPKIEIDKDSDLFLQEIKTLTEKLEKEALAIEQQKEPSTGEKIKIRIDIFFAWLNRIFNPSARMRYGLFRPLVAFLVCVVVLLGGFNEIYLKGGDTFGIEGLYDYIKLFLWGVVSDFFAKGFTDNPVINSLSGKK